MKERKGKAKGKKGKRQGKEREKMKGGKEAGGREETSLVTFRSTKTPTQYLKNYKWR